MVSKAFCKSIKIIPVRRPFQNHCELYRLDKTGKCLLSSAYGNLTDKCIVSYFHPKTLFFRSKEVKKWVGNFWLSFCFFFAKAL